MDLNSLFAQIGSTYQQRCQNLAREAAQQNRQPAAAVACGSSGVPGDEYIPSEPADDSSTYSFLRQARLDYVLDLSFDLGTVTRLMESYANGQAVDMEQLTQAGFGLSADLTFSGYQRIKEYGADFNLEPEKQSQREETSSATASSGAYQGRDVEAAWFSQESSNICRSLKSQYHGGHRQASNKLEMRFRLDSNFRLTQINRFNEQTGRLAAGQEQALPGYFDNVGALADGGSSGTLTAFFNAVDSYLDGVEDQLVDRAETFFATATEELGFSGSLVETARDQLTGSIESFFARVETALDQLQGSSSTDTGISSSVLPFGNQALDDLYNPVADQLRSLLATA